MTARDPFADLQSALALTPSAEFSAHVRARVAEAPRRRAAGVRWLTGAALATAAAAMVIVSLRDSSERVAESPAGETSFAIAEPVHVIAPAPVAAERARAVPVVTRTAAGAAVVADPFGEVLVPDDQRIALERLLAAMKSGRTSIPRAAAVTSLDEDGNVVITPLPDIAPMKIEPLAGTPADTIKREIKREP